MRIFGEIGTSFYIQTSIEKDGKPEGYVVMSEIRPDVNYIVKDNGDGTGEWIIDASYIIEQNKAILKPLFEEATLAINILEDEIELEMTTNGEAEKLKEWKKYRILLTRVDTSVEKMELPEKPE